MRDKRKYVGKTGARLYNPQENMSAGKAGNPLYRLSTAISVKFHLIEKRTSESTSVIDFFGNRQLSPSCNV